MGSRLGRSTCYAFAAVEVRCSGPGAVVGVGPLWAWAVNAWATNYWPWTVMGLGPCGPRGLCGPMALVGPVVLAGLVPCKPSPLWASALVSLGHCGP